MLRTLDAWHDPDRLLRLAAQTFFDQLSQMCEGILVVDRASRIVWVDHRWQRNIRSLGFSDPAEIIGRPVEEIVPNTLMRHVVETGKPILLDILENKAGTYIVSRFPVHDESGMVIGAVDLILYDRIESLEPLMGKLARLRTELAQAQSELARQRRTRYTFSNFVGNSERALEVKSRARRAAVLNTTVLLLGETGTGKELLARLPWKGNVRELRNLLERACSLWDGIRLSLDAFREVVPELAAMPVDPDDNAVGIARATLYQKLAAYPGLACGEHADHDRADRRAAPGQGLLETARPDPWPAGADGFP